MRPDGKRDFGRLTGALNLPLKAIGRCGQPGTVWHCVLSAAPADRLLSDSEWNAIATDFMYDMGLAREDDPAGVRWVAVRHGLSKGGIDHVHIAATLARQDGGLPSVHNDFVRARRACQAIEQKYGLTVTAPADHTATPRPTRAETEQAARKGRTEPPRIMLRRLVQEAAAAAASETDFFTWLRDAGALVRERQSTTEQGRITGYAVTLPSSATPIWFGGGKLAPDLTLPRLRRRWERSRNAEHGGRPGIKQMSQGSVRAVIRSAAVAAAEHARNEAEYFRRLQASGVLIRYRFSDINPGQLTGYSLTLDGHQDAEGDPIWYGGGKLALGLTLPRLGAQWNSGARISPDVSGLVDRQAMWADITRLAADTASRVRPLIAQDPGGRRRHDFRYRRSTPDRRTDRTRRGTE